MKIEGLDALTRSLRELQQVAGDLDGHLANVSFDPEDPESIEQAIQSFYAAVDAKVGRHARNAMVDNVVGALKEQGRQAIIDRAATARLAKEDAGDGD